MKKSLIAAAATAVLIGTPAMAADIPVKAPPIPPASWSGCYVGANLGGGWSTWSAVDPSGTSQATANGSGIIGGGQLGCDYRINSFTIGIQGMLDGSAVRGSGPNQTGGVATLTNTVTIPWLAALTSRVGFVAMPAMLIYVKGGGAWIHDDLTITANATGATNVALSYTASGWTLGAGVEYAFAPQWSAFAEYDYMDFGTTTHSSPLLVAPFTMTTGIVTQRVQAVLFGINRRF